MIEQVLGVAFASVISQVVVILVKWAWRKRVEGKDFELAFYWVAAATFTAYQLLK